MKREASPVLLDGFRRLFEGGVVGSLTDGQLLDGFGAGGGDAAEPAFAALVERHGPMVLGVCRRLLGDHHLAEDAFQATFLILARRGPTIREGAALGGWLHRVARRVARRSKARSDRWRRYERPEGREVAGPAVDPAEQAEVRAVIDAELDRLGASLRLPIILCDLEGWTHEEAAQQLRWPVGTVKSRLARGRRRLRDRLQRLGFAPAGTLALGLGLRAAEAAPAVPVALGVLTVRGAVRFVAGRAAASVVASTATSLANQELLAMTLARWLLPATVVALGALAASGAVILRATPDPINPAPPQVAAVLPVAPGPAPAPPALLLGATGRVLDPAGKPVSGATVLIREWSAWRTRGFTPDQYEALNRGELIPDILARTQTDAGGRFRLEGVAGRPFPSILEVGRTEFPWDLVVLAEGHGVAHEHLTAVNQKRPLTLTLPAERLVRGRVVEPGGQPVAGAKISVNGVGRIGEDDQHSQKTVGMLNLGWSSVPLVALGGADGRFTLRGLPAEVQVSLIVLAPGHARDYLYYATTDQRPADLVDVSIRSGQRTETPVPIRTGDLTIELQPADHRLVGRVIFEDGGKPVVGTKVFRFQQPVSDTDADGRFTIDELTAGPFELHVAAWKTNAVPLAIQVEMPAEPKVIERTFLLPRGGTLAGQVTDELTGRGVEGVELRYDAEFGPGDVWSFFGCQGETDAAGRYQFLAPAGRGKLEVVGVPPGQPPLPTRGVGESAAARFGRVVQVSKGATVATDFTLPHGQGVALRVLGADDQPVVGAEVRLMALFRNDKVVRRTDDAGRCELIGLDPAQSHTADILHPGRKIGARVIIPPHPAAAVAARLTPLGTVASRVLDDAGQPLEGASVLLYADVEFPERYGMPISNMLADGAGGFRFDRLLAGVDYYLDVKADGHANATSERFQVKPGQDRGVAEFRLPTTNQTLDGFVVDAQGKRLANITVAVDRDAASGLTPSGKFVQETDSRGEFHLDRLPAGELKLMAYRRPEATDRTIRHLVRAVARAGSKDVRIVLTDRKARLQGIED